MSLNIQSAEYIDPKLQDILNSVQQKDDAIPFLLFPVRVETRFMQVDRPLSQSLEGLEKVITEVVETVDELNRLSAAGSRSLANTLKEVKTVDGRMKKAIKSLEKVKDLPEAVQVLLKKQTVTLKTQSQKIVQQLSSARPSRTADRTALNRQKEALEKSVMLLQEMEKTNLHVEASRPEGARAITKKITAIAEIIQKISEENLEVRSKPERQALYVNLDNRMKQIEDAVNGLETQWQSSGNVSTAELTGLRKAFENIETMLEKVPDQLNAVYSRFKKKEYQEKFKELKKSKLDRLKEKIEKQYEPEMKLQQSIAKQSLASVYAQSLQVQLAVRRLQAEKLTTPAQYRALGKEIQQALKNLQSVFKAVVVGRKDDYPKLQKIWDAIQVELGKLLQKAIVIQMRSERSLTTADKKVWNEIRTWHMRLEKSALQELPNKAVISRQAILRSARVFPEITQQLDRLNVGFEALEGRSATRKQQTKMLQEFIKTAPVVQTYGRQTSILSNTNFTALKRQQQQLQTAVAKTITSLFESQTAANKQDSGYQQFLKAAAQAKVNLEKSFGSLTAVGGPDIVLEEATQTVSELWVRIYPDDIFVHAHEPELTADEVEAGKAYWIETWIANGNKDMELAAWRTLTAGYGSQRAAWIAKVLTPQQVAASRLSPEWEVQLEALNEIRQQLKDYLEKSHAETSETVLALKKIEQAFDKVDALFEEKGYLPRQVYQKIAGQQKRLQSNMLDLKASLQHLRMDDPMSRETTAATLQHISTKYNNLQKKLGTTQWESTKEWLGRQTHDVLSFPQVAMKEQTWSRAPYTNVLPDRFAVLTIQNNRLQHIQVGNPIPATLNVGLDPQTFHQDLFAYDAEGNLSLDENLRWMTDFNQAVQKGMGLILNLTSQQMETGFDKVLVLGVNDSSAAENKTRLENLLQNHHYAEEGMSFLPIGTATNNTEKGKTGYSSADRSDEASFAIERQGDLFSEQQTDPWLQPDGLRLANALGISPEVFKNIENSGDQEISQALIMHHALWPATVGYYSEDILDTFFTQDTQSRLRHHFSQFVSGRGLLPSLRIGSQPYGILPTTAFSKIEITPNNVLPTITEQDEQNPAVLETKRTQRFAIQYLRLLNFMKEEWNQLVSSQVKHHDNTDPQDPQMHFMTMLGLHASSVETYQRYNVNVASRRTNPVQTGSSVNFSEQDYFGPQAFRDKFKNLLDISPQALTEWNSKINRVRLYRSRYLETDSWLKGPRVAEEKLSETQGLQAKTYQGKQQTYIDWLLNHHLYGLWNENNLESLPSKSLLFLLLRQSLLLEYRNSALDVLVKEELIDEDIRALIGDPGYYYTYIPYQNRFSFNTKWSWLFFGLHKLNGIFRPFGDNAPLLNHLGEHSLAEFLYDPDHNGLFTTYARMGWHQPVIERINELRRSFTLLNQVPTAKLERLFAEHMDICSHRLDAWILSLANQKLAESRAQQPQGIFLGAFGWLENLRPGGERRVAPNVPDSLQRPGEPLVYTDEDNQGFIHAPSLSHAATAAILRSGYISNKATDDIENQLAVNLSSRRVRRALYLFEGVRQGHELGALLGYQFERGLHERYTDAGLELDAYIFPLRRRFPSVGTVDEALNRADEQNQVVDGEALLQAVRQSTDDVESGAASLLQVLEAHPERYPFGMEQNGNSLLPAQGTAALRAVLKEIDRLADTFDALGDLLLSESVYQVARGNHTRAAAVVTAISEGRFPPEIQVVKTPRGGLTITQRVAMCFEPMDSRLLSVANGYSEASVEQNIYNAKPAGWKDCAFTARAFAEPSLNKWLGEMIGDPEKIRCIVDYPGETGTESLAVSLKALDLQPLDLVQIMGAGLAEGGSELNSRISYWVRQQKQLESSVELTIYTQERSERLLWTDQQETLSPEIKTFYEMAPLIKNLLEMIQDSRPMAADEVMVPSEEQDETLDPKRQDKEEYAFRVQRAKAELEELGISILKFFRKTSSIQESLLTIQAKDEIYSDEMIEQETPYIQTQLGTLRELLFKAAAFGIFHTVPESAVDSSAEQAKVLTQQLGNSFTQILKRLHEVADLGDLQSLAVMQDAFKKLFGRTFRAVPFFSLRNAQEMATVYAARDSLMRYARSHVSPFAMDLWFQSAVKTRKRLIPMENVLLLADTLGQTSPALSALQFPYQADDYWTGLEFPEEWQTDIDRLSLVVGNAHMLAQQQQQYAGLIVDEWIEIIPHQQEVSGITFNYDQPGAMPPQSALLALSPNHKGSWQWEHLVHTLLETLEIAKLRAVEPDHLDQTLYSQLLPAVMSEVVPQGWQPGEENPMGVQIILDFKVNNLSEE